tara:strand:+ start:118 stop:531 length:414 start_codon:yes stop_codon:yes gene_type:complete
MKSIVKENNSKSIKKLKESDFSVTQFSKDFKYGKKHEKLVMKSREDYELKTDRLAHTTGNAFVEIESRKKESGIITSKSSIWIFKIVDKNDKHLFSIEIPLDRLRDKVYNSTYRIVRGGDNLTSRGYLIPLQDLISI